MSSGNVDSVLCRHVASLGHNELNLRQAIVLVSERFSPSGEQPEQRKLAHTLLQPTDGCRAIFHKYCCDTKHVGIITNLTLRNVWAYITNVMAFGLEQEDGSFN